MSDINEEVYSIIFNALRHGVRRKILRMLSADKLSFTSIAERLGITSSHLTYHLEALGELVSKDDSRYTLSIFGRAAVDMMNNVEDTPSPAEWIQGERRFKVFSVLLLIGLIIVSGLYIDLFNEHIEQRLSLDIKSRELETLETKYEQLYGLQDLVNLSIKSPHTQWSTGIEIVSGYSISYWHRWGDIGLEERGSSFIVFYSPYENLVLRMYHSIFPPTGMDIPLTLQKGNAFLNQSGVLVMRIGNYTEWQSPTMWAVNVSENKGYEVLLPSKGWYTLSMLGPISKSGSGAIGYRGLGYRWFNGTWQRVETASAYVDFRLLREEKPILFAVDKRYL